MSASQRQATRRSSCELETVTNWPTVFIVGGLTLAFLVVPLVVCCWPATKTAPQPVVVQRPARPLPPVTADEDDEEPATPSQPQPALEIVAYYEVGTPPPLTLPPPPLKTPLVAVQTPPAPPPTPLLETTSHKGQIVSHYLLERAPSGQHSWTPYEAEESALQQFLYDSVRTLDLNAETGTSQRLLTQARTPRQNVTPEGKPAPPGLSLLLGLMDERKDLQGLPLLLGDACQADAFSIRHMTELGRRMRRSVAQRIPSQASSFGDAMPRDYVIFEALRVSPVRSEDSAVPALVQLLQVESRPVRLELVKRLADIEGSRALKGLVQRAVHDLSPDVRRAAVIALKERRAADYRGELLAALRYPGPFAADHAAEALVALDQRDAVPALVDLLDRPDPQAPFKNDKGQWAVRELVSVNHFRNCLLCHAPSTDRSDSLRGVIPEPGKTIPELYYDSGQGEFVQASVTYIKQDFSLMHDVPNAKPWPTRQRHDYFVRTRLLESGHHNVRTTDANYPQREAVLKALRQLTGQDCGDEAQAWHDYLRREWLQLE